ncbi:chemokine XC receptor 1-like [Centropristis striata]|uniref:chemokine XC receptor 1-like n=1 Tax=Centropristis striata TaxID=184440 RepID=UPI0027DF1AE8|nr:chemokine XC receptor 1-like [Centropristis striata]
MANNPPVSGIGGGEEDTRDVYYLCDELFNFDTISAAFFILIFIISIAGNCLLLCVLVIYEDLKNVTNVFILNLACSDLIFTATLPFYAVYRLHHWVFGDFACKFITAVYIVGLYSSIILLTAMTVDRFTTVVLHNRPSNPVRRQRCAVAACVAAWGISIAASVSDAINVKVETTSDGNYCVGPSDVVDDKLGYYLQVSLLFFLPFAIIVFCYSAILKTVLQTKTQRKRHRTVVVVLGVVVAFFICWGPFNILLFIESFYEPEECADERLEIAYAVCRILAFSHCCMNPLLYTLSQKLRSHLFKLLRCEKIRQKNKERVIGQSTSVYPNVAFIAQNSVVVMEPK